MAALPFHDAIPRYHQIAQLLRQRAVAGGSGGLATEQALCAEFGVSRTTVRQALEVLKRDGLLESRRRGVGTRIGRPRSRAHTRSSGDPLHQGLGSKPRIVSFAATLPPPEAAAHLGLAPGQQALRILRTHELAGEPLSVVDSWLPLSVAPGLSAAALKKQTLHELLWERHGLAQARSTHVIRVARADHRIARLLGVALADPLLQIQSRVVLADGSPIRWTENWFREDRYQYTAEMVWKKPAKRKSA